jgi:hypothetical protein
MKEKYLLLILTIVILVESILIYFVVPTLAILLGLVWLFNLLLALGLIEERIKTIEKYLLLILTIVILVGSILIYFVVPTLAILLGLVWLFNLLLALELGLLEVIRKMRKRLVVISIFFLSVIIVLYVLPSVMPSVMKYPHNLVQSFSPDVIENESNVLRRNINDTVENVNIDIKQSNENVEKKEDYIKKEYFDSATYSYNVVNTISGILTPLLSLGAVIAAFVTLYRQRKQNAIQNFENHLFQMIDQQHKLEKKVVNEHGSFRELYEDFSKICSYVFYDEDFNEVVKGNDKRNEIGLKIANYIFYFGADKDFLCDKTFQILTGKYYGLDQKKLKAFIIKLIGPNNSTIYDLFHTQKSEELGIYYRNLFNAIRYIDWECPEEDKKEYYAKLVRTNLSDFAQLMLYYNMQGERGNAWLDKDEVKDPKGDQDGYYSKKNKDGKLVRVKDCLLTRYKPIKNCAISINNKPNIAQICDIAKNLGIYQDSGIEQISNIVDKLGIDKNLDIVQILGIDKNLDIVKYISQILSYCIDYYKGKEKFFISNSQICKIIAQDLGVDQGIDIAQDLGIDDNGQKLSKAQICDIAKKIGIAQIRNIAQKIGIDQELDIDPRNDGRRELFSDKVIDYELKIEEKAWNK